MAQDSGYNAQLIMGGVTYQINSCAVDFNRNVGPDGRPSSTVYGGKIVISAPITKEVKLAETMINNTNRVIEKGEIKVWESGGAEGVFREIEFTKGFIVNYHESFDMNAGSVFNCSFTISAETIGFGGAVKLDNNWPKTS